MQKDPTAELLKKYTFNPKAPKDSTPKMDVYRAVHSETNLPFTIKIIKSPSTETYRYLQKIKQTKSDYVIRIQQLATNNLDKAVAVFEDVSFSNLENALSKCKRLEDSDALYVAKCLLYGHIDLTRSGITWTGGLGDIQITDNGIKLSWNGADITASNLETGGLDGNVSNPFGGIIEKLSFKDDTQQKGLLPFPKNKQILDLIKVSSENASQMSLHPLLKKRDKLFKKKGKSWLALRETKSKNEYFDETSYFAVSPMHGFVRVKSYEIGRIDKDVINLNKTKPANYVRVIEDYQDGTSSYLVSEYSNDGNLQQYVTKLKTSNVVLKEDQIEFFLYSLIEPIKQVQNSSLQSINTIHIKNIYIQNGIPKLGQPYPMTAKIEESLKDKSDVPDFYHPKWKASPASRDPSYDTYSLGILLYKLMYTEYPIFPEGKVHIPTTPNYNSRIKKTLEIFLNEGGRLQDLESKVQVSETVKKQIKQNKAKLIQNQKVNKVKKLPTLDEIEAKSDPQVEQLQPAQDQITCWDMLCEPVHIDSGKKSQNNFFVEAENSPFKSYRMCTKILLVLLMYVLVMYLWYLSNIVDLLSKLNNFQPLSVTISAQNYTVVVADTYTFYTSFNATGTKTYDALANSLYCGIDSTTTSYSSFVKSSSVGWVLYLVLSLLVFVCLMVFKMVQLIRFDLPRAVVNYQSGVSNFNISSYIIFNLVFALAIFSHYFLFNFVFHSQTSPCLGGDYSKWFSSTVYLFKDRDYLWRYIISVALSSFVLCALSFFQIIYSTSIKYSRLFNPVVVFVPFYLALFIMGRVGVYTPFSPSFLNNFSSLISRYVSGDYIAIFGIFPQLLLIGEFLISMIVDWVYWRCLDRKVHSYVGDESFSEQERL